MTKQDLKFATFGRYLGKAVVLGTRVSENVVWVRWAASDSWFKLEASEIGEF